MVEPGKERAPWEIPPDEGYWRALLEEGEYLRAAAPGSKSAANADTTTSHPGANSIAAPQSAEAPDVPSAGPVHHGQRTDPVVDVAPPRAAGTSVTPREPPVSPGERSEASCWERFLSCQEQDESIELPVIGFNRGGLLVKWRDVVGFVPASQLCDIIVSGDETARQEAFSDQVGSTLTLKVIEVDASRKRLILSERAARRVDEPDLSVLEGLLPGDVCHGTVTNLCSFGVFVDLGGIEGLIHISELSWGRVNHPADVLQSGEEVEVYVLNVEPERGRVGLSLKRLYPDPWETADSKYGIGEIFVGTITNIVNFGAFVRLEEGLEGLIHNSEWGQAAPPQSVREGDNVQVRVISLDSERHRMGLSLEKVTED
jgi:small subunit ribosomal protein S1